MNEKILIESEYNLDKTIDLNEVSLVSKLKTETNTIGDDFVLYIYVNGCTSCLSFKNEVLNPFIKETGARIYSVSHGIAKKYISLGNKDTSPVLAIFKEGSLVNKTGIMYDENTFASKKGLKEYIEKYGVISKMKYILETDLDELIKNANTLVYFSWNLCGDCKSLDENYLKDYLLNNKNEKMFYILETAPYREEGKEAEWLALKDKYGLSSYYGGRVPSLVYYENGMKKDMAVYLNDMMEQNEDGLLITGSYYDDAPFINQTFKDYTSYKEGVKEFHNNKIKEFLEKYYN